MMLRALALTAVCGFVGLGLSSGDALAARKGAKAPPRCMEAIVPKCTAPQFFWCDKKNKCGACAKWVCRSPAQPRF